MNCVPGLNLTREELWLQASARAELEAFAVVGAWQAGGSLDVAYEVANLQRECWTSPAALAGSQAILRVLQAGDEPDMVRVGTELRRTGDQQAFSELIEFEQLYPIIPPAQLKSAIAEIREMGARRARINAAKRCIAIASDLKLSLEKVDDLSINALMGACHGASGRQTGGWLAEGLAAERDLWAAGEQKEGFLFTQIPSLNRYTGGFGRGQVIVIAAWPKTGKTAFILWLAQQLAAAYGPVYVEELEMAYREMVQRAACSLTATKSGELSAEAFEQARAEAPPVYIECAGGQLEGFLARTRRFLLQHPNTAAVFVDYMGLLQDRGGSNQVNEAARVSGALKALAVDNQIPVFVCQQLNRNLLQRQDKTPILSDLRDGNILGQDLHKLIFLHHPYTWQPPSSAPPEHLCKEYLQVILAANRNGKTGMIPLRFEADRMTFEQWEHNLQPARKGTAWNEWGGGDWAGLEPPADFEDLVL